MIPFFQTRLDEQVTTIFSCCIFSFLRIWSHLLRTSLMKNFIFVQRGLQWLHEKSTSFNHISSFWDNFFHLSNRLVFLEVSRSTKAPAKTKRDGNVHLFLSRKVKVILDIYKIGWWIWWKLKPQYPMLFQFHTTCTYNLIEFFKVFYKTFLTF